MPVDVALTEPVLGRGGETASPSPGSRPPERAQLVWRRALQLADPPARHDRFALALHLLRAAHHDPTTMAHALTLGRTHLRAHADAAAARKGATILEAAIAFLGVKRSTGDIGRHRR